MKLPLRQLEIGRVLPEAIAESLREAILSGHFQPAEKLDQELIAQELGVSRTPVREAIRILESEGFIQVRPHYGAFITAVSRRKIEEIYEIRLLLEPEVVRQVTPHIPEAELDEMQRRLRETQTEVEAGDLSHHFETDTYFEETIRNFCQNEVLKEVLVGLSNRFSVVRRFALRQPGPHLLESFKEHADIVEAIRQRDSERAAELTRYHLKRSAMRIKALAR